MKRKSKTKTANVVGQEIKLETFWKKKLKGEPSDCSKLISRALVDNLKNESDLRHMRSTVCNAILEGKPLTRQEYYFALACGFLLIDLPYLEFFKTRWHETATHRAYGTTADCDRCKAAKLKEQT